MSLERWNIKKVARYIVDVYNLVSVCFLTFVLEDALQNAVNDLFRLLSWYSLTLNSHVCKPTYPQNQAFTPTGLASMRYPSGSKKRDQIDSQ